MAVAAELETIAERVAEHIDSHILPQWEKRIFETVDRKLTAAAQPQSILAANPELMERIVRVEEGMKVLLERSVRVEGELKAQGQRMDQLIHQTDKRFEELIHYIDKRFEELIHQMDKRFEQTDKRFEQMDKRFEQMDKRFEQMNTRFVATQRAIFIGFTVITTLIVLFRFLG